MTEAGNLRFSWRAAAGWWCSGLSAAAQTPISSQVLRFPLSPEAVLQSLSTRQSSTYRLHGSGTGVHRASDMAQPAVQVAVDTPPAQPKPAGRKRAPPADTKAAGAATPALVATKAQGAHPAPVPHAALS